MDLVLLEVVVAAEDNYLKDLKDNKVTVKFKDGAEFDGTVTGVY